MSAQSEKRNSSEAQSEEPQQSKQMKYEDVSTEDLEEAMYSVSKSAASAREMLTAKAKHFFEMRNGRSPSEEELEDVFNTLRDSMIDEDCGQSSEDDDDEGEDLENLQKDVSTAFEHVRDLGKEAGQKMHEHLKSLWKKETGTDISTEETEAVMYHLKHLTVGAVPVEEEDENDEEYQPSELEKEAADAEEEPCHEKESVNFDFTDNVEVSEEQFEKAVEKFCETKGREPTEEEADAILQSFSKSLAEAQFDEHDDDDYEEEDEEESEDEELEEDKSLEQDDMECEEEESEIEEFTVEEQSSAFKYMKEVEEGVSDDDMEEEPSKQEQSEEIQEQSVVA